MDHGKTSEPTERRMVVATADIGGFSRACQGKSGPETFRMLDKFYYLVDGLTTDAGGTVLKFMGDAALMLYPKDNAAAAVASLASLRSEAQAIWTDFDETCVVHTKAHVGSVICGRMGPAKQFDAIGDALNELFRMPAHGPDISVELQTILSK